MHLGLKKFLKKKVVATWARWQGCKSSCITSLVLYENCVIFHVLRQSVVCLFFHFHLKDDRKVMLMLECEFGAWIFRGIYLFI